MMRRREEAVLVCSLLHVCHLCQLFALYYQLWQDTMILLFTLLDIIVQEMFSAGLFPRMVTISPSLASCSNDHQPSPPIHRRHRRQC